MDAGMIPIAKRGFVWHLRLAEHPEIIVEVLPPRRRGDGTMGQPLIFAAIRTDTGPGPRDWRASRT